MKNFSILKKLGAAAVSAAMLASVGTVGFAAPIKNGNVAYEDGDEINITGIDVAYANNIYKVKVDYNTTVDADKDITMLAYVGNPGGEFSEVDKNSIIAYNNGTMQIVGVDQQVNSGTIEFSVTDNIADISVRNNTIAIIKLGGEGINNPAAAIAQLDGRPVAVEIATKFDEPVTVKRSAIAKADGGVDAAVVNAIKAELAGGKISVKGDDNRNYAADFRAALTGDVYDSSNKDEQTLTYTVTVAKADNVPEDAYRLKEDLTAEVTVKVPAQEQVISAKLNTLTNNIIFGYAEGKTEDDVKTRIKNQTVNLYSRTDQTPENFIGTYPLKDVANDKINATEGSFNASLAEDYDITYTVTLSAGDIFDGDAYIDQDIPVAVPVHVTLLTFTVDPAKTKLYKGEDDVTETALIEIEAADAGNAKEAVEKALVAYNARVYPVDGDEHAADFPDGVKWNIAWDTSSVENKAGEYTVTGTLDKGHSVGDLPEGTTELKVTVKVKVKSATPAYILGDVDNSGEVDWDDWAILTDHLTKAEILAALNDSSSAEFKSVDFDKSEEIDWDDWAILTDHLTKAEVNPDIGK